MIVIFLRTLIAYIVVLIAVRIMGKSELAKLSPFQMVVLFMLGELASLPLEDPNLSLITGFTGIFTLILLQTVISALSLKFEWFKNFISGKPSIIIDDGQLNEKEMKRLRLNLNDLAEQLRIKNYASISDIAYAVMESNGSLSVIPKPGKANITPNDLDIMKPKEEMPLMLICDGTLYRSNLQRLQWSEDYFITLLSQYQISSYKEVLLAFSDENKKLHVYPLSSDGHMSVEVIL